MNVLPSSTPSVKTNASLSVDESARVVLSDEGQEHAFAEQLKTQLGGEEGSVKATDAQESKANENQASDNQAKNNQVSLVTAQSAEEAALAEHQAALVDGEGQAQPETDAQANIDTPETGAAANLDLVTNSDAGSSESITQNPTHAMEQGAELLGRLQQASASLREHQGKSLPSDPEAVAAINANLTTGTAMSDESGSPSSMTVFDVATASNPMQMDSAERVNAVEQIDLAEMGVLAQSDDAEQNAPNSTALNSSKTLSALDAMWSSNLALDEQGQWREAGVGDASESLGSLGSLEAVSAGADTQGEPALADGMASVVPLEILEQIEQSLAQGMTLSPAQQQIVQGLKQGTLIAELPPEQQAALRQLSALISAGSSAADSSAPTAPVSQEAAVKGTTAQAAAQVNAPQSHAPQSDVPQSYAPQGIAAQSEAGASALAQAFTGVNAQPVGEGALTSTSAMVSSAAMASSASAASIASTDAEKALLSSFARHAQQHGLRGASREEAANGMAPADSLSGPTAMSSSAANTFASRLESANPAAPAMTLSRELAAEQVAEKIQMMLSKNLKNIDIRLDPPELGRLQIRLSLNNDATNVHFSVSNGQAREMIEQTLPRLREMLAQSGMQLAESSVQQQSSGQSGQQYARSTQGESGSALGMGAHDDDMADQSIEMAVNVPKAADGISFYA